MEKYINRKKKEIEIIGKYLPNYTSEEINNLFDALHSKEQVTHQLKRYYAEKYYHELTNKDAFEIKTPFLYQYTYERFNGFIEIDKFANYFYNLDNSIETTNYFTNCGMSAIGALLTSVISSNEVNIDLMYEETYFETIKYISTIMKNKSNKKILYIDSIASDFKFNDDINFNNYIAVIIDTTCFLGKNYKEYIEKIIEVVPCILVRSHTKLDLVGTEFSHIGSVSFVYHKKIDNSIKKIEQDCRHLIGVYGACLPPDRFPQFILDKELSQLNEKRLERVTNNNEFFYKELLINDIKCSLPNHKQFSLIYFDNSNLKLDELKEDIKKLSHSFENNIPVYHAVSFGFDYIAIDCYENFNDGKFKIRICMSDIPQEYISIFTTKFIKWFKEI